MAPESEGMCVMWGDGGLVGLGEVGLEHGNQKLGLPSLTVGIL